jgi:hypothetical protein
MPHINKLTSSRSKFISSLEGRGYIGDIIKPEGGAPPTVLSTEQLITIFFKK